MRSCDFDFYLPPGLIAQAPAANRDQSRLMVLDRAHHSIAQKHFSDLPAYLRAGDVVVLNDSKVFPARLRGRDAETGRAFELLLLHENNLNDWWAMLKPGKRARPQSRIQLLDRLGCESAVRAVVVDKNPEGHRRLRFEGTPNILDALTKLGEVPLPPYIRRRPGDDLSADAERYQTVYAAKTGSIAAPTAGLHFTDQLLQQMRARGIEVCAVTLHVGLGTFAPVKSEDPSGHPMHEESFSVSEATARTVNDARSDGRRIIAVGTTSVRVLETLAAVHHGRIVPGGGQTRIFIHPPYSFRIVGALLTNFHLPRSTLLMLVAAFAAPGETGGLPWILSAYQEAIQARYRFFSYGDAMLIL